jgi:hypothetical protein
LGARQLGLSGSICFVAAKHGSPGQVCENWLCRKQMPWKDGILECWNTEDPHLAEKDSFLFLWHLSENQIRPSTTLQPQYSIFPSFQHSIGFLTASTTPLM